VPAPDSESLAVARRYYRLFNERRLDEAGQLVHPEAEFHYVATHQRLRGRAGYRALVAMWLNAFEDAVVEVVALRLLDEATVEADLIGRGTQTGDLVLGEMQTLPPTGRGAEMPFREVLHIRHGLITSVRLDFDLREMERRLRPEG